MAYKSLGSKNEALIRGILEKCEDGDMSERQVRDIFEHIKRLQKLATGTISDWEARFNARSKERKAGKAA